MATIGQRAEEKAKIYFDLYVKFLKDFTKEKSENLALYDIICDTLVCEFAEEKLKEMIKNY